LSRRRSRPTSTGRRRSWGSRSPRRIGLKCLPVLAAPIARPGALPRGIQIIGAPFTEALLFRVAAALEGMGVVGGTLAQVPTVQA
jgi:hypothetical protein